MEDDIKAGVEALKKGGVLLFPTDTGWNLGCDATNASAVEKIYQLKQSSDRQDIVVLFNSDAMLERYINNVPEVAYQMIEFSEKPAILILEGACYVASNVLGENQSIALRVTTDDFCKRLIERHRKPIATTSVSKKNEAQPLCFADIAEELVKSVDFATMHRRSERKGYKILPSIMTIKPSGEFKIIRQ